MLGLIFYRFIFIPLWITWLLVREAISILRGRTELDDLLDRLGRGPKPTAPVIWIHGASLGELGPARALAEAILTRRPDHHLIISAHAPHARNMVQAWGLPRTHVTLAPLDMRWSTRRFLRGLDCRLHVTIENELWPNRFILLAGSRVPIVAVSARMSARSLKHWRIMGSFPRRLMGLVTWLAAQAPDSRANLLALGLPEDRILPDLNLKALVPPRRPTDEELAPFVSHFDREHTVLGASTHPDEEQHLLAAFAALAKDQPRLRLIIAPRRTSRGAEIAGIARALGLTAALRSNGERPTQHVYVADTLHEMSLWYALATATFVGGSLADFGGHTPYEPIFFSSTVLHGPYTGNFGVVYEELDRADGAIPVTIDTFALRLREVMADDTLRRRVSENARLAILAESDRLSSFLDQILP